MEMNNLTALGTGRRSHVYSPVWEKVLRCSMLLLSLLEVQLILMKGQSIAGFFHYAVNSDSNYSFILLKSGWFCLKQFSLICLVLI